jgi:hypothetical protein
MEDREKESALSQEIEDFKREKERIRAIVGRIGSAPTFGKKLLNVLFALVVFGCFLVSFVTHGQFRLPMIEIGIMLISVKIIYLLHNNARQMHFMFWVLTSLEWRLNEIVKSINKNNEDKE